ncbi:hypothetical protein KC725_01700 [Candidatus Peregrinibacteria bacterium]|nr:hypothetical protein [Candidatus Peregrinibacteria bacterium]
MRPKESPFEGTVDVSVSNLQQPAAPFKIGREISVGYINQAFQGQDPSQETVSIKQGQGSHQEQQTQFDPQEYVNWYRAFPINPREVNKQYQELEQHMAYALTSLGEHLPQEIQERYQQIAQNIHSYHEMQMELLRTSHPDPEQLTKTVFTDTFVTTCAKLLNDMKALGEKLYLRLNEQVVRERRMTFQASQGGQEVRKRYPFLADRYTTSLDTVEKAKEAYEKEVRDGVEVDCHQAYANLRGHEHTQKYPLEAIKRYAQDKTEAAIKSAIEAANLPDEVKIQIYQQIPKAIHTFSSHSNEQETASYMKLDRIITRNPETEDLLSAIIANLIRGYALSSAAYRDENENLAILWAYSYAIQKGHTFFLNSENSQHNGAIADTVYIRSPKMSRFLSQEGFFQPLERYDAAFIPDYLALAMGNKKLEFVAAQLRDGFSSQQNDKHTIVGNHSAFLLFQRSTANQEILTGYSTQGKPEAVVHIAETDDAVTRLNNLRLDAAMAIHALMQRSGALSIQKGS